MRASVHVYGVVIGHTTGLEAAVSLAFAALWLSTAPSKRESLVEFDAVVLAL